MVYINDVLKRCEEKGHKMTRMGVYVAGRREGFIVENNGDKEFLVDKFNDWISRVVEKPPEGYLSARQIADEFKVSLNAAYSALHDPNCRIVRVGCYRVIYGERKSIEEAIGRRGCSHRYNWGEKNE